MLKTPYDQLKKTELWYVISGAIDELIENDDLEERTTHDHIVGYLCQKISSDFEGRNVNEQKRSGA